MELKKYKIDFGQNGFVVSLKNMTKKELCGSVAVTLIVAIFFLVPSIISFSSPTPSYFHAVIFLAAALLCVAVMPYGILLHKRRVRLFGLSVDDGGIRYKDIRTELYIPWERVLQWGFVNRNSISGTRSTPPYQTCLYFSTNVCEEQYLRRKFDRIDNKTEKHRSNSELVVWGMGEDDIGVELLENIVNIISLYSDGSHRFDSLVDEWGLPKGNDRRL